jgi:hypothetical protein
VSDLETKCKICHLPPERCLGHRTFTDRDYVREAKEQFEREGEIEFDDSPVVSRGEDPGAYVQAWVWVDEADIELRELRRRQVR